MSTDGPDAQAYAHVAERLATVRGRIRAACERAGRLADAVQLVAVSKRHPPAAIEAAYAAGQRTFGENYVQELRDKAQALGHLPGLSLRFIGSLQRNKAGVVAECAGAVDSVDSERLARALDRRAQQAGVVLPVLLQVNVGREPQKGGVMPEALPALAPVVAALPALRLQGLMAIPPAAETPEAARPHFRSLRRMAEELGLPELSMGMSADLDAAVEEGATMVRVGTAIFGPRRG